MPLVHHIIKCFKTHTGYTTDLAITYQLFGQRLGDAPIVLVNHALTGNSTVAGANGWWRALIGPEKAIDTNHFTILAIDIPGNGFGGGEEHLFIDYKELHNSDIARVQYQLIEFLGIRELFAVIGGSLGGQIAWELAVLKPKLIKHLIPVATDWKATDWVIAQCLIQEQILNNSSRPLHDARLHAMTFYRTAASFKQKFNRSVNDHLGLYNVESWLLHHGAKLEQRFQLSTYRLMNHLLGSADITQDGTDILQLFATLECEVHLVAIDTDGLFYPNPIRETQELLKKVGITSSYHEIQSIHGHDAFLIEYEQLSAIVQPIFQAVLCDA